MASSIVRFDPFADLYQLQREVNRLFDNTATTPTRTNGGSTEPAPARAWSPAVDILEDQNEIIVRADLPGINQDDIDIEITGDTLTLKGERKFEDIDRKDNYVRVERSYGKFQRAFTIGIPVDADGVKASYKDGILEVRLPKSEATKPKKVLVSANN